MNIRQLPYPYDWPPRAEWARQRRTRGEPADNAAWREEWERRTRIADEDPYAWVVVDDAGRALELYGYPLELTAEFLADDARGGGIDWTARAEAIAQGSKVGRAEHSSSIFDHPDEPLPF